MTDQTKQTGATDAQIEAACERGKYWHEMSEGNQRSIRAQFAYLSEYLIPEDQCIVPRSFVSAAKAVVRTHRGHPGSVIALECEYDALPEELK